MTTSSCVECGSDTERASLVVFRGGDTAIIPLCKSHMAQLHREMLEKGVRVESAEKLN